MKPFIPLFKLKVLVICLLSVVNISFAEEGKPSQYEQQKVALASTLAAYGESENDALALANAANIYFKLSGRVLKEGETGVEGAAVDPIELLGKAREISQKNGDQELVAVIDNIEQAGESDKSKFWNSFCVWEYVWIGWHYQYRYICF